jgi:hypothetical protein
MMRLSFFDSKRLSLVACLCGLLLSGCAAGTGMIDPSEAREKRQAALKQESTTQQPANAARRDLLTPALTSINNRIYTYGQKVEEWKGVEKKIAFLPMPQEKANKINECRAQLQNILYEYSALQMKLLQDNRADSAQLQIGDSLLLLNQQDIDYLESGCSKLLAELKVAPEPTVAASSADPQIKAAFESTDYDRVITLYGQVALTPGSIPAYETTYQYGRALLKNHQEAVAHKVLVDLLGQVRQQQGQELLSLHLMQVVADLDFGLGSYEDARRLYEEVARIVAERGQKEEWVGLQLAALQSGGATPEELKQYSVLLKNYLAYTPKRDGYAVAEQAEKFLLTFPASRLVANVNTIHKITREQADAWLNQGIKRIEALAGERKPQEPTATTGQGPADAALPANQEVTKTGDQAATAQTEVGNEKALQDEYDRGVAHLTAKEYDKAIERFSKLLKTPLGNKARAQIEEASRLGAQEDRQKAADLFVRSTSTRDQESKKKLLLSSRELLQGILTKYPQAGLNEKVQRNLSRIEEELKTLGSIPSTVPPVKGGAYVPPVTNVANPSPGTGAL